MTAYVPCCRYPQGSGPWTMEIVWQGHTHRTLAAAKKEGFDHCGCDDFNIAVIDVAHNSLILWTWMGETIEEGSDELAIIADQLGYRSAS